MNSQIPNVKIWSVVTNSKHVINTLYPYKELYDVGLNNVYLSVVYGRSECLHDFTHDIKGPNCKKTVKIDIIWNALKKVV